MSRPTPVTVFGSLDVLYGGGRMLRAMASMGLIGFAPGVPPGTIPLLVLFHGIHLVTSVIVIFAGVGLLTMKPWSRRLGVGISIFNAAWSALWMALMMVGFSVAVWSTVRAGRGVPPGMSAPVAYAAMAGAWSLLSIVFPVSQVYYLTRPSIIAAFMNTVPATVEPMTPTQSL